MKNILLILVLLSFFFNSHSQDLITTTKGEEIKAKVKEIGESTISYYKFDNQAGPLYTKNIETIFQIKYENGTIEIFNKVQCFLMKIY